MARCPYCGYEGRLATPIVYHDADKELLLTYFPPELGMPLNEQERLIGPMITQIMNRLPPEKRKGYLLKPIPNFTFESMVETILGKDGITPEMIKAQQERLSLIDRLLQMTSADVRSEVIKQNTKLFDEQFFALFSRSTASRDPERPGTTSQTNGGPAKTTANRDGIRPSIAGNRSGNWKLPPRPLQEAGQNLTREKLLDIMIQAPTKCASKHTYPWHGTGWITSSSKI